MRWRILAFWGLVGIFGACQKAPQGDITLPRMVRFYASPSLDARELFALEGGQHVAWFEKKEGWIYACYEGRKGWIFLPDTLLYRVIEGGPLFTAQKDSAQIIGSLQGFDVVGTLEAQVLQPWFEADSLNYAGIYQGLVGEEFPLLIVNFVPDMAILLKRNYIDEEEGASFDLRTEEYRILQFFRQGNVYAWEDTYKSSAQRIEFVKYKGRPGVLLEVVKQQKKVYYFLAKYIPSA
ncbi:MAG: hypothetical protein ACUVRD_05010 [Bacteroidia bacterium]